MKNKNHEIENLILKKKTKILDLRKQSEQKIKTLINRTEKDISNTYKYFLSNYIISLLPDIDNLEKSVELSKTENSDISKIHIQLNDILELFLKLFRSYNIQTINEVNVPFDPNIHQAITLSHSKTIQSNYIISVIQKGYKLHNRLLRPAMVVVSQ